MVEGQTLSFHNLYLAEIAQSEAKLQDLRQLLMHNGFINVDNEKMSKSLGNFVTVHVICLRQSMVKCFASSLATQCNLAT